MVDELGCARAGLATNNSPKLSLAISRALTDCKNRKCGRVAIKARNPSPEVLIAGQITV